MADDLQKPAVVTNLRESVSSGTIEARDSQGFAKPANLQQPDVIALPTAVSQQNGNSQPVAPQSVANNGSDTSSNNE
jgi:hypothetical protein